ncbi:MAG: hypothetical protein KGI40_06005 [Xanthomonadaceae bacterium]|nr:hypothetical protein [Xanthomonadaceae bacterium]MDE1958621.1 hypothetical protein [Xanthomonadaceae bacterium]MDE2245213.1 hypothetical protein [Xanthomonadaceae bacterium]
MRIHRPRHILIAAAALLAACSSSQQAPTPAQQAARQQAAQAAAAAKEYTLYQQLLASHGDALAVPIGQEIVRKYPGTPAAAEVQQTLPALAAQAAATAERQRLRALWLYQAAPMAGGRQTTAAISAVKPDGDPSAVRLVLRRHTIWGQSVYLYDDSNAGFLCKGMCTLTMRFDGRAERWQAYLPHSSDPALFIKDDRRFIAAMEKAGTITMDVVRKPHREQTLRFEVGGFDPAQFPQPTKQ